MIKSQTIILTALALLVSVDVCAMEAGELERKERALLDYAVATYNHSRAQEEPMRVARDAPVVERFATMQRISAVDTALALMLAGSLHGQHPEDLPDGTQGFPSHLEGISAEQLGHGMQAVSRLFVHRLVGGQPDAAAPMRQWLHEILVQVGDLENLFRAPAGDGQH